MRDVVRISVAQFDPEPLAVDANLARMADTVREERARHEADIVIFPELATTGYVPATPTDEFRRQFADALDEVPGRVTDELGRVAQETQTHVVTGLGERGPHGEVFNSIAWITAQGELAAVHRKVHLFARERSYFAAGDRFEVFDTDLGRVGLSVCYDSKFPEASRAQALAGAEILICIFTYAPDPGVPADILMHRAVIRAWENAVFYVAANRLGRDGDDEFVGRSAVAGPTGQVLNAIGDGRERVVRARLTADAFTLAHREEVLGLDRRPDVYGNPQLNERNGSS